MFKLLIEKMRVREFLTANNIDVTNRIMKLMKLCESVDVRLHPMGYTELYFAIKLAGDIYATTRVVLRKPQLASF